MSSWKSNTKENGGDRKDSTEITITCGSLAPRICRLCVCVGFVWHFTWTYGLETYVQSCRHRPKGQDTHYTATYYMRRKEWREIQTKGSALLSSPGGFSTWKMSCSSRFVGMNDRDPLVAWHAVCIDILFFFFFFFSFYSAGTVVTCWLVVWIASAPGGATRVDTFHSVFSVTLFYDRRQRQNDGQRPRNE